MKNQDILIVEFDANLVGITVFAEGRPVNGQRLVDNCTSLIKVETKDGTEKKIAAQAGSFMENVFDKKVEN